MTESPEGGEIFGRYLLSKRLGTGGMGVVHAATWVGPEGVARPVCIKRVRAGGEAGASRIRLFVDEARLSMGLSHGNVVQTIDFGRVGDEYFLALELVDGTDLGTLLGRLRRKGARVPTDVAAFVAAAICDGLAYAHSRGVVHRDVKPGNVLLSRAGEVKIADFGVAALAAAGQGGVRGTAAYMAPEQARGEVVDARADVYATGLVLYEMLAGHAAHGGRDETAILARAKEGRIGPLEDAPEALAALVRRMTEPDASQRPANAHEIADALGGFVAAARGEGATPPARWLAAEVEGMGASPDEGATSTTAPTGGEGRPSTYFTRDGAGDDFVARLAQTRADVPRKKTRRPWLVVPAIAAFAAIAWWVGTGTEQSPRDRAPSVALERPAPEPRPLPAAPVAIEREPPLPAPTPPRPRAVRASKAATTRVETAIPAVAPATLDVNARPYAIVEVDGVRRGETPIVGLAVAPGEHAVRFVNPVSGRERTTRVTVSSGERRAVTADLRAE